MTIRPSLRLSALPASLPFAARFGIAREAGFEGIELELGDGPAAELREAADAAGLVIHSVHCWRNYSAPLSSPEPAVRDAGVAATLATLEAARVMGADSILLVPGVVGADATYAEVDARSRDVIRQAILPEAERLGIVLAVENVWNGFLLSPFDCARYVGSFESPFVRLYFDVGNVVFGRPEGWIDIAGSLIAKLHLKDLRHWHHLRRYEVVRIGEGDIDWRALRAALARSGFAGWAVAAEAETAQPFWPKWTFALSRRAARRLPPAAWAEAWLSRRIAADAMRRFQRYVRPGPSAAPASAG